MSRPIEAVGTSVAAFVGSDPGPPRATRVRTWGEYRQLFGAGSPVGDAVHGFFAAGGGDAWIAGGLADLDPVDDLGLLLVPGASDVPALREALAYAEPRRAFLVVDPPGADPDAAMSLAATLAEGGRPNAALYYPPVEIEVDGAPRTVGPAGAVAGTYARIDASRGVWKAPAGEEAVLPGVTGLAVDVDRALSERLAQGGVNAIRRFPGRGIRVWGGRTIAVGSPEWRYVSVRRTALFLERSIDEGLDWAVFEPNDEPLWAQVRAATAAFLERLFRAGAFPGPTPWEAYYVRCGRDTMTQDDLDSGYLNVAVGVALVRPAEFVVLRIQKLLQRLATDELRSTGEAGQRLQLSRRPVAAEGAVVQVEEERGWVTWAPVPSLERVGPEERAYELDRERGELRFGDGRYGAVPPAGARIQATYRYGAGD